jgi:hypothetical protein
VLTAARVGEDVGPQLLEDLLERLPLRGGGAADAGLHLLRRRPRDRPVGTGVRQSVDEPVDGEVAELPHRLGIEAQPILEHGMPA